ncbi:hypothetical protein AAVH_15042, partial [Aphelenchoides avenae]
PGELSRRIMKSLTAIMLLVVFGWFVTSVAMTVGGYMHVGEETMLYIHLDVGWSVNFAIAMNYFVYFLFSADYRAALLEQLNWLRCKHVSQERPQNTTSVFQTSGSTGRRTSHMEVQLQTRVQPVRGSIS